MAKWTHAWGAGKLHITKQYMHYHHITASSSEYETRLHNDPTANSVN